MKKATLYRMVTPDHLCPWGLKALHLLKREPLSIDDRHLASEEENQRFKEQHNVEETPQVYIDGQHIGGYEELRIHLGLKPEEKEGTTYQPIIAIFATSFLAALAITYAQSGSFAAVTIIAVILNFIALSMCVLAVMKLRDLSSFFTQFLSYDLLARRYVPYAYIYPFAEAAAGILMLSGSLGFVAAPIALFIGLIGAVSVIKAVYIDKRELKCACVGGNSNVPLGFISLTENLMMIAAAIWMLATRLT